MKVFSPRPRTLQKLGHSVVVKVEYVEFIYAEKLVCGVLKNFDMPPAHGSGYESK